jgi:hypothetical protein
MAVGNTVPKYGTDMGEVVVPIQAGQHAHVHNIKTKRRVPPAAACGRLPPEGGAASGPARPAPRRPPHGITDCITTPESS